jgi:hypothetical protein
MNYLCNNHKKVRERLFATDPEGRKDIDKYMNWFQSILRTCTSRIIRNHVGPICFGERKPSKEEIQKDKEEFY